MATSSATTNIWNSQSIETEYYHNIIHHGLEKTHSSLTLGKNTFSVTEVPENNGLTSLFPTSSSMRFSSPPTIAQLSLQPRRYLSFSEDNHDLTTYRSVLNSPAVRENARSFEQFHVSHQPVASSCYKICQLTTQITSKTSESLIPKKDLLEDSYLQSITLRGVESTHKSLYIYGYHVGFVVNNSGALSVTNISSNQSSESIQSGFITRLEQVVNQQSTKTKRSLAEVEHRNNRQHSDETTHEGMLESLQSMFSAMGAGVSQAQTSSVPIDFSSLFLLSSSMMNLLASGNKPLTSSIPELKKKLTIVYPLEGTLTNQSQTKTLSEFIGCIIHLMFTNTKIALHVIKEVKRQVTTDVYDQLNLSIIETYLVSKFEFEFEIQEITAKVNLLPDIKKHQVDSDAQCCIMFSPFDESDEIIEIRTGKNPECWRLISKKAVMGILGSDKPINNPFDRSELSCDDFRSAPITR